jgi:hypothetical protein
MPSRERLARINLHEVSFGVDKFSAELDLVDSCSSTSAANNHLVGEYWLEITIEPNREPHASRSFPNSLDLVR